jgi:hypothetical protein
MQQKGESLTINNVPHIYLKYRPKIILIFQSSQELANFFTQLAYSNFLNNLNHLTQLSIFVCVQQIFFANFKI